MKTRSAVCVSTFLLFLLTAHANAQPCTEKIFSFSSDVAVLSDSTLDVVETIRVQSCAASIRRGIYRDFPTDYRDRYGHRYQVEFKVTGATRDGLPEKFQVTDHNNGKRVYIGDPQFYLVPGEYTYTISYTTGRQLGFFKDHDELYWNVTGNGWAFPIEEARAVIHLPSGISLSDVKFDGYTGYAGEAGKDFAVAPDYFKGITIASARPLKPMEGLTAVVSWPKGFVKEPDPKSRLGYFYRDNRGSLFGLGGLFLVLLYYLTAWVNAGKDPARGPIVTLYEPPEGLSPAAARYILKMGFDNRSLAANIIGLAAKGLLKIDFDGKEYKLIKLSKDQSDLCPDERVILRYLFAASQALTLKSQNHTRISDTISELKNSLRVKFEKVYFFSNTDLFLPGLGLSLLSVLLGAVVTALDSGRGEKLFMAVFISLWLSVWSFGVAGLLQCAFYQWKQVAAAGGRKAALLGQAVAVSLFTLPFLAGEVFGIGFFVYATNPAIVLIMFCLVALNFLFYHLLKAPTLAGRRLMDKIEGFREFLAATEQDRLRVLYPAHLTPEVFEKFLPYAFALDVEQAWSERFSASLRASGTDTQYVPGWYSGASYSTFGTAGFAASLGSSLSGAISSSAQAPGRSSGMGSGSSGGGGGGGGGGGW